MKHFTYIAEYNLENGGIVLGILSRFKDIMASNVHAVFNREDKHPEKTVNKYLTQMKMDLGQVKAETDALRISAERAQRAVDENMAEQEKLKRYIDKCNESGNTSDALSFQRRLEKVTAEGEVLNQRLIKAENDLDSLRALNEKLTQDMETLESKMNDYNTKMSMAEAQEELNKIASRAGAESTDEMFSRMNDTADRMMDRANAMAELESGRGMTDYDELQSLASKYDDSGNS